MVGIKGKTSTQWGVRCPSTRIGTTYPISVAVLGYGSNPTPCLALPTLTDERETGSQSTLSTLGGPNRWRVLPHR